MNSICVIGMGYIGLPTATMFATHGLNVIGVDINERIVSLLKEGEIHIQEPGLRALFRESLATGNLKISNTPEPADAFIIAVPTPITTGKNADMAAVVAATESITSVLKNQNLVVLESTSPPGTTIDLVKPILERTGLKAGKDFYLAYSPERVLPGRILQELIDNDRIIGGIDPSSTQKTYDLYSTFVGGDILLTDTTSAELVKLLENTYRDVNIAIANEFSRIAHRFNVDIWEIIHLANKHPRVNILNPGPGVGGHCISVDPWFLVESAPDITPLIKTSREVNDSQPYFIVDLVEQAINKIEGAKISVLGLTYKANVDDLRESPAIMVANLLQKKGALVSAYDPFYPDMRFEKFKSMPTIDAAIKNTDLILLLVAHNQFAKLTPDDINTITPARTMIDTVNLWDKTDWEVAGFRFFSF